MAKTLKVAVIGVGGIARLHMPGWEASEHAEVVAGADVDPVILADWGVRHNIKKLTTDVREIFSDPDIDIVDLCVPNMHHAPLAIAALDAGKHVLCEKPLAPMPGEIRRMIEARDRSGKLLMTAQHFRFAGVSQAMKREIERGVLGEIYHARSWMLRRAYMVPRTSFTTKAQAGGGPCIDIGVHVLDLTLWLMGQPAPVTVSGVARQTLANRRPIFSTWRLHQNLPMPKDFDVEDFAAAFVRFDTGATMVLEVSWFMHHDTDVEDMQIWLYGVDGGCHWPKAEFLSTDYATRQFYNTQLKLTRDAMEPHALECVAFARAVAEGAPSPVPPEDSLKVIAILDGIYRSQREGREVRIEL